MNVKESKKKPTNNPTVALQPASSEMSTPAEGSNMSCATEPNNTFSPTSSSSLHPLGAQFHPPLPNPTLPAVSVEEGVSMDMLSGMMDAERASGGPEEPESFSPFPLTFNNIDSVGELPTQPANEGGRVAMIMSICSITSMDGVNMDMPLDIFAAERTPGDEEELAPGDEEELAPGDGEELAELAPGDEEELAELDEEELEEAATQPTNENERVTVITPTYTMTLINDVHMYVAGDQSDEEEYQGDEFERFPDAIDLTST